VRHDPQDGAPGDRGEPARTGTGSAPAGRSEEHRRGPGRDRREGADDRRAHLGQAPAAGGSSSRLRGLGPQLPPGSGGGQEALAAPAPDLPTLGARPRRTPGHRLVQRGWLAGLLRRVAVEPVAVRARGGRPEGAHHHAAAGRVLRADGWGTQGGAGRSDGLPQGRRGGQRGRPHPPTGRCTCGAST
jgi:hypothetical protein